MMSVALAGPASNVFLAVVGGVMLRLYALSAGLPLSRALFESYFGVFCLYMITINLGLAAFNLIPLPPLDGSKVLSYFLSPRQRLQYRSVEDLGPLLLILIVSFGLVGQVIGPVVRNGTELIIKFFF
jgi:Zn-dependent protease